MTNLYTLLIVLAAVVVVYVVGYVIAFVKIVRNIPVPFLNATALAAWMALGWPYLPWVELTERLYEWRRKPFVEEIERLRVWKRMGLRLYHMATPDPDDELGRKALVEFLAAACDELEAEQGRQIAPGESALQ